MNQLLYFEQLHWKFLLFDIICAASYALLMYQILSSPVGTLNLIMLNLIGFAILIFYFNFRVLKVKVTSEYIEASYGIFFKRVPLKSIESIVVKKYTFLDTSGWGIRFRYSGGLTYNIFGDDNNAVLISYINKKNKKDSLMISSKNPAQIVDIVQSYI
ncbi:MAG: hypothetical protein AB7V50_03800, partial [Vampirovibrionia bacterium]